MRQARVTTKERVSLYVVIALLVSALLLVVVEASGWLLEALRAHIGIPNPWWVTLLR